MANRKSDPIQCPHCQEWFASQWTVKKHRVGPADHLRCLTPDEMLTKKLRRNEHNHWVRTVLPPGERDGQAAPVATGPRKPYGKRKKDLRKELAGRYRQGWI